MGGTVNSEFFCEHFISTNNVKRHARIQGVRTTPEKLKNIGFLNNTGPDPLKNHKATKPEFNVGQSSTPLQNAI